MAELPLSPVLLADFQAAAARPAEASYDALLALVFQKSPPGRLAADLAAFLVSALGSAVHTVGGVPPARDSLSIIALRAVLTSLVAGLGNVPSPAVRIEAAEAGLSLLQPRVLAFEEQDTALKLLLADAYQRDGDFAAAARALQSVSLESSQRPVTATHRADIWVRIARCHLEDDDPTAAAAYINRAKNVMHEVDDKPLRLNFQMSQARILDSQRHFLDAAAAYHAISFEPLVDEDDRLQTLSAATVCAVLAPAGPSRARALARLYKDERTAQTHERGILEKMFLDRVLDRAEVAAFAARLAPHQLARTADGATVLDRAVLEHNLLGASRLYRNIGFDALGALLGVDGPRAEQYAAHMIEQARLAGSIDQVARLIHFDGDATGGGVVARKKQPGDADAAAAPLPAGPVGGAALRRWNANVQALAEEVEKVASLIQTEMPAFYAANMAH